MLDFVLFTCSYGEVTVPTITSVEKLHKTDYRFEWWFQTGDALISRSRSVAAYKFLNDNPAPYMIFLDGDMVFEPIDIEKVLVGLRKGLDVVAGLYPVRGGDYLAQNTFDGRLRLNDSIHEFQYVSTGFMGISRDILQRIAKDMPVLQKGSWAECYPFFEDGMRDTLFISEDWDFCDKVRKAGGKVYAHTGVQLGHLKEKIYTAQETLEKIKGEDDSLGRADIWEELSEYLGGEVRDLTTEAEATTSLREQWNKWEGTTEEFYSNPEIGRKYLFDLTGFNSHDYYWNERLAPILCTQGSSILDIGCGIGTALLELCHENKHLVGCDPNNTALGFARYRATKIGAHNIEFTDKLPGDLGQFDLIMAIDTLEHIEDLRGLLMQLGRGMRPGAKLYHFDSFGQQDISPMHFNHSKEIDEWIREAGLVKFSDKWCIKPEGGYVTTV